MNSPRKHTSSIREKIENSGDKIKQARLPKRMRIAFKIADAIDASDLTNKQVAEKFDKYSSEISKWLKGDHNFTIDTLSDIEEILGIQLLALDNIEHKSSTTINVSCEVAINSVSSIDSQIAHNMVALAGGLQSTNTSYQILSKV